MGLSSIHICSLWSGHARPALVRAQLDIPTLPAGLRRVGPRRAASVQTTTD